MPIYEYECKACGHRLDAFQKLSEDPLKSCPECHKDQLEKLISAAGFQLKGSGWYKTDYSTTKDSNKKETKSSDKKDKTGSSSSSTSTDK